MAVKEGQDTTALKAEIAEKLGKFEEVRVFHDNEQVASHCVILFFFFHALAFGAGSLLIQLVVIVMNNLSIYSLQPRMHNSSIRVNSKLVN